MLRSRLTAQLWSCANKTSSYAFASTSAYKLPPLSPSSLNDPQQPYPYTTQRRLYSYGADRIEKAPRQSRRSDYLDQPVRDKPSSKGRSDRLSFKGKVDRPSSKAKVERPSSKVKVERLSSKAKVVRPSSKAKEENSPYQKRGKVDKADKKKKASEDRDENGKKISKRDKKKSALAEKSAAAKPPSSGKSPKDVDPQTTINTLPGPAPKVDMTDVDRLPRDAINVKRLDIADTMYQGRGPPLPIPGDRGSSFRDYSIFTISLHRTKGDLHSKPTDYPPIDPAPETHPASMLKPSKTTVWLRIIASKKRVDKRAAYRTRAVRRVFNAFKWCVQREGLQNGITSADDRLITVVLSDKVLGIPMDDIVQAVRHWLTRVGAAESSSGNSDPRQPSVTPVGRAKGPNQKHSRSTFIEIEGLLPTTTPNDVMRAIRQGGSPGWQSPLLLGVAPPRATDLAGKVESLRRVYEPAILEPRGSFILEVTDPQVTADMAQHIQGRFIGGRIAKTRVISPERAKEVSRIAVVGLSGSSGSDETALGLTAGHSPQIGDALRKIIQSAPGQCVIIRGLPAGLQSGTVQRRLSRQYALATSAQVQLAGGSPIPMDAVYKLQMVKGQSIQAWREGRRSGIPLPYSIFFVRLASVASAHRLVMNFNASIWRVYTRSDDLSAEAEWDDEALQEDKLGQQEVEEEDEGLDASEWTSTQNDLSDDKDLGSSSPDEERHGAQSRDAAAAAELGGTVRLIDGVEARSIDEDNTSGVRVATAMRTYVVEAFIA